MALLAENDPGNRYASATCGTTGIGYDARQVARPRPTADRQLAARLRSESGEPVGQLRQSPSSMPERDPRRHADVARQGPVQHGTRRPSRGRGGAAGHRPTSLHQHSAATIEDLASGSICVMVGWSRRRAEGPVAVRGSEAREPTSAYVIPVEGTLSWFDMLAIPKDAPHPDEAYAFTTSCAAGDIGAKNATSVRYATFNRAALAAARRGHDLGPVDLPAPECERAARDATTQPRRQPRREPHLDTVPYWQ